MNFLERQNQMSAYLLNLELIPVFDENIYLDLKRGEFDDFLIGMLCISEFSIRYKIDLTIFLQFKKLLKPCFLD